MDVNQIAANLLSVIERGSEALALSREEGHLQGVWEPRKRPHLSVVLSEGQAGISRGMSVAGVGVGVGEVLLTP